MISALRTLLSTSQSSDDDWEKAEVKLKRKANAKAENLKRSVDGLVTGFGLLGDPNEKVSYLK